MKLRIETTPARASESWRDTSLKTVEVEWVVMSDGKRVREPSPRAIRALIRYVLRLGQSSAYDATNPPG